MLTGMDPELTGLVFRPALLDAGVTDDELRRLRRQRRLTVVRRGAYVTADDVRLDDQVGRHVLAVRAAVERLARGAVVSHASAAALHGLTMWEVPLRRVHVTVDRDSGGRRTDLLHVHAASLHPDDVVEVGGLLCTSVARTVVDLARTLPFEPALVVADAARHRHRVSGAALEAAVARVAGRRGGPDARRVVAAADPRPESPGETRSRIAIARRVCPRRPCSTRSRSSASAPTSTGTSSATVGEFDGKVKYGRALRPGQIPGEAVFAEKRREDALRDLGSPGRALVLGRAEPVRRRGGASAPRVRPLLKPHLGLPRTVPRCRAGRNVGDSSASRAAAAIRPG